MNKARGLKRNFERNGASNRLCIFMHGWQRNSRFIESVLSTIRQQLPDCDIAKPEFSTSLLANEDAFILAAQLELLISHYYQEKLKQDKVPYLEIYLVGHSLGSLILRKAYIFGRGVRDDYPMGDQRKVKCQDWVSAVKRIVLLGGVNRGWSLIPKPEKMSTFKWLTLSGAYWIATFANAGRHIKQVQRGEPFVINLRVQWLRMVEDSSMVEPMVVQLLGALDDIVGKEDNMDMIGSSSFIFLPILESNTDHVNIVDFTGEDGKARREEFVRALTEPEADLRSNHDQTALDNPRCLTNSKHPNHVIFVLHGIRDDGGWTVRLAKEILEAGPDLAVITSGYDRFPMGPFLLSIQRQKNVRWFADAYTEAISTFPGSDVSFVGHSNGTYIAASALKRYSSITFKWIMFGGSVVPRNFPWRSYWVHKRVAGIRNDIGSNDFVVGWFPRFFEWVGEVFNTPLTDIGSAGFSGFTDSIGNKDQIRFITGDHGAAFTPSNFKSIAKYVTTGTLEKVDELYRTDRNKDEQFTAKVSDSCWAVWLLILTILILVGTFVSQISPLVYEYSKQAPFPLGLSLLLLGAMFFIFGQAKYRFCILFLFPAITLIPLGLSNALLPAVRWLGNSGESLAGNLHLVFLTPVTAWLSHGSIAEPGAVCAYIIVLLIILVSV